MEPTVVVAIVFGTVMALLALMNTVFKVIEMTQKK